LNKLPYGLFQVNEGLYAVSSKNVREIIILTRVTSFTNVPPENCGVINLQGVR